MNLVEPKGECFSCSKVHECRDTNVQLILAFHTCFSYAPVSEAEFQARVNTMQRLGEFTVAKALLQREEQKEPEEMSE